VSLLPLGGYVKMVGESADELEPGEDPRRALGSRPLYQRALIVLAGPLFNFILAWVVYTCMFVGPHTFGDTRLGIVTEGDQAWMAGIRPGDKITAIDGVPIDQWDTLQTAIAQAPNSTLNLTYLRDGASQTVPVHTGSRQEEDIFAEPLERGKVGVSLQYVLPVVSVVDAHSPAAAAGVVSGDHIFRVNDTNVTAWHEVRAAVASAQENSPIALWVGTPSATRKVTLLPSAYPPGLNASVFSAADVPFNKGYTGLVSADVVVTEVTPDTPAAAAGIQVGDRLLAVQVRSEKMAPHESKRRLIGVWGVDLVAFGTHPNQEISLQLQRDRTLITMPITLRAQKTTDAMQNGQTIYVFGAKNDANLVQPYTYDKSVTPLEAASEGAKQVWSTMTLISRGIGKMVRGDIPMASMGGPIMLFVIAEKSAAAGWATFFNSMAMTSVNLGLLNILPVPVLDGGHLLFFAIEGITRRPPSVRVREWANMVGLGLLLLLMVVVFRNDAMRFFFHG
jgi:regulator of sigma E protease